MAQPPPRSPLSSHTCSWEVWRDGEAAGSPSCLRLQWPQTARPHHRQLPVSGVVGQVFPFPNRRAVCCQVNKYLLLFCQLCPARKLQCWISSISITSVTSWRQAGIWWVQQLVAVTGQGYEERIMAEWYSNNYHHNGPHLHKIFNCHDHKMSKSTCS